MLKNLIVLLTFVFLCFTGKSLPQIDSNDNQIPSDLLITYERTRPHQKFQINSNGEVFFKSIGTSFKRDGIVVNDKFSVNGKTVPPDYEKTIPPTQPKKQSKLTNQQLFKLIEEFEKLKFFNLESRYPTRYFLESSTEKGGCINPGIIQTFTLQKNFRSKTVVNDLSCSPQQKPFKELGLKVEGLLKIVETKELKDKPDENKGEKKLKKARVKLLQ